MRVHNLAKEDFHAQESRYSEAQIIGVLREHEAGATVADLSRQYGVSQ